MNALNSCGETGSAKHRVDKRRSLRSSRKCRTYQREAQPAQRPDTGDQRDHPPARGEAVKRRRAATAPLLIGTLDLDIETPEGLSRLRDRDNRGRQREKRESLQVKAQTVTLRRPRKRIAESYLRHRAGMSLKRGASLHLWVVQQRGEWNGQRPESRLVTLLPVGRPGCAARDAKKRRPKEAELTVISNDVRDPAPYDVASVRSRGLLTTGRSVVLALLGALTLASATLAASAALTPAHYRANASAICVRMHSEMAGLASYGNVGTRPEMIQYLTAALPTERSYLAALRRLRPPSQLRSMHDGFVADEVAQLALTTRFLATLKVTTNGDFLAAVERWGAEAATISSDEKALLIGLRLPKCI
jgi:hypothetical protein